MTEKISGEWPERHAETDVRLNRRSFLKRLGCIAGSAATLSILPSCSSIGQIGKKERPNIIYIMTDDHASHALSCYGSRINQTPNLDRIANEGMRFNNSFCTNSICAPCRAVVLTGKYSHINGKIDNSRQAFDGSQQTFPKLLQQAGYQTAMIGKWHLRSDPTGFDYWNVLPGQGLYYNPVMIEMGERKKYQGYVTDIITDHAMKWLKERDPDKPFCLMFHHKAPHRNWQPSPKHLTLYDDVTMPEPDNLFDDYANRGRAAKEQDMTIAKTMNSNDLKLTAPKNLTGEQKKLWDAAYNPKNDAFHKANLQGKDLVRWKYQRYIKDYLRCIASVDDNVGRVLDYLEDSGLAQSQDTAVPLQHHSMIEQPTVDRAASPEGMLVDGCRNLAILLISVLHLILAPLDLRIRLLPLLNLAAHCINEHLNDIIFTLCCNTCKFWIFFNKNFC